MAGDTLEFEGAPYSILYYSKVAALEAFMPDEVYSTVDVWVRGLLFHPRQRPSHFVVSTRTGDSVRDAFLSWLRFYIQYVVLEGPHIVVIRKAEWLPMRN